MHTNVTFDFEARAGWSNNISSLKIGGSSRACAVTLRSMSGGQELTVARGNYSHLQEWDKRVSSVMLQCCMYLGSQNAHYIWCVRLREHAGCNTRRGKTVKTHITNTRGCTSDPRDERLERPNGRTGLAARRAAP